jgi:hypothetical protein
MVISWSVTPSQTQAERLIAPTPEGGAEYHSKGPAPPLSERADRNILLIYQHPGKSAYLAENPLLNPGLATAHPVKIESESQFPWHN